MRKTAALALLLIAALLVTGCGLLGSNGPDNKNAAPAEAQEVDSQNPAINKVGNVVSVYLGNLSDGGTESLDVPLLAQAEERCPRGVAAMSALARNSQEEYSRTTYVVMACNH